MPSFNAPSNVGCHESGGDDSNPPGNPKQRKNRFQPHRG
ncbi:hypothetical protein OH687_36200 [Burkholderia anthina]|nr:hypothetical protein OH687_36200 [Burkholderia anthina]